MSSAWALSHSSWCKNFLVPPEGSTRSSSISVNTHCEGSFISFFQMFEAFFEGLGTLFPCAWRCARPVFGHVWALAKSGWELREGLRAVLHTWISLGYRHGKPFLFQELKGETCLPMVQSFSKCKEPRALKKVLSPLISLKLLLQQ